MRDPLQHWLVEGPTGWSIDLTGELDPDWSVPWAAAAVGVLGALLAWNAGWQVFLPFLAIGLGIARVWRGEPLYGLCLTDSTLTPVGLDPLPRSSVQGVEAEGQVLVLTTVDGPRRLQLDVDAGVVGALAERLA